MFPYISFDEWSLSSMWEASTNLHVTISIYNKIQRTPWVVLWDYAPPTPTYIYCALSLTQQNKMLKISYSELAFLQPGWMSFISNDVSTCI
jgi:hypothetical protein